jgi:hypothetical protein
LIGDQKFSSYQVPNKFKNKMMPVLKNQPLDKILQSSPPLFTQEKPLGRFNETPINFEIASD